jgi:opacity protein-like surface antigen
MFCSLALITLGSMKAQERGTISPFLNAGYTFDETIPYDFADLKIAGGFQWGLGVEYFVNRDISVDLKYNRMDSEFSAEVPVGNNFSTEVSDGSTQYYLLGMNKYFNSGSKAIPFIGGGIGVGIMDMDGASAESGFAWDIRGGVKINTGGSASVKLQAYLQSLLTSSGSDYWYYWGYVYSTPDYHRSLSFGLSAVIGFDIKK